MSNEQNNSTEQQNSDTEIKNVNTEQQNVEKQNAEDQNANKQNADAIISETQMQIDEKNKKKKKTVSIILICLLVLILLLVVVYFAISFHYKTRFLKNTYINGVLCDEMEVASVVAILDNQNSEYCLEVYGRDPQNPEENVLLGEIHADEIDYKEHDSEQVANKFLESQNPYKWIYMFTNTSYDYKTVREVRFDAEKVKGLISNWQAWQPENMKKAENAYIQEPSDDAYYTVVEGMKGSELIGETATEAILTAVENGEKTVNLEEYDCYNGPRITTEDWYLIHYAEKLNMWLDTKITYDWHGIEICIDRDVIKDWISLKNGRPYLDEEAVKNFLETCSEQNDAYGKQRKFTTTLGEELVLPCSYGWLVDKDQELTELLPLLYDGVSTTREPIYSKEGYSKGTNELGASYVEIDMSNQHLYLYFENELILESDFVSGCMSNGCYTPEGIFGLTYKTRNAILRGANYASPVKYWMPFNKNIGMHDASWRKTYGGEIFMRGGSHGCINLPLENAKQIYEYMEKGFPVVCYYYEPVEDIIYRAKHPNEFPKKEENPAVTEEVEPTLSSSTETPSTETADPVN